MFFPSYCLALNNTFYDERNETLVVLVTLTTLTRLSCRGPGHVPWSRWRPDLSQTSCTRLPLLWVWDRHLQKSWGRSHQSLPQKLGTCGNVSSQTFPLGLSNTCQGSTKAICIFIKTIILDLVLETIKTQAGLTWSQCLCLSRGHFVDFTSFIHKASLDHFEVKISGHFSV